MRMHLVAGIWSARAVGGYGKGSASIMAVCAASLRCICSRLESASASASTFAWSWPLHAIGSGPSTLDVQTWPSTTHRFGLDIRTQRGTPGLGNSTRSADGSLMSCPHAGFVPPAVACPSHQPRGTRQHVLSEAFWRRRSRFSLIWATSRLQWEQGTDTDADHVDSRRHHRRPFPRRKTPRRSHLFRSSWLTSMRSRCATMAVTSTLAWKMYASSLTSVPITYRHQWFKTAIMD